MEQTGEGIQELIRSVADAAAEVEGGTLKMRAVAATPKDMPEDIMRATVDKGLPLLNEEGIDLAFVAIPLPEKNVTLSIWILRPEAALTDLGLCEQFAKILESTDYSRLNIIF